MSFSCKYSAVIYTNVVFCRLSLFCFLLLLLIWICSNVYASVLYICSYSSHFVLETCCSNVTLSPFWVLHFVFIISIPVLFWVGIIISPTHIYSLSKRLSLNNYCYFPPKSTLLFSAGSIIYNIYHISHRY